jgi:hypothetical protein
MPNFFRELFHKNGDSGKKTDLLKPTPQIEKVERDTIPSADGRGQYWGPGGEHEPVINIRLEIITQTEVEAWKNDIEKLVQLYIEYRYGDNPAEKQQFMRAHSLINDLDHILLSLSTQEFTLNMQLWRMAHLLWEQVCGAEGSVFKPNADIVFVPLGGAVHGGGLLKMLFEISVIGGEDLDLGIMCKIGELLEHDLDNIASATDIGLRHLSGNRMELCTELNPRSVNLPHFHTVEEAEKILFSWDMNPHGWKFGKHIMLYFHPSIPKEANERHKDLLLAALTEIAKKDEKKWQKLVNYLMLTWAQFHYIKDKHLVSPDWKEADKKTGGEAWSLAVKIANNSPTIMGQPMYRLLLSTNPNYATKN